MGLVAGFCLFTLLVTPSFALQLGDPAPPIVLKDLQDKKHQIDDFNAHLTVIHFWATWCSVCLVELPELIDVGRQLNSEGMALILIAADSKATTAAHMQQYNLQARVLIDQYGKAMRDYAVEALPTSILIDRDGKIVEYKMGKMNWEVEVLRKRLQDKNVFQPGGK